MSVIICSNSFNSSLMFDCLIMVQCIFYSWLYIPIYPRILGKSMVYSWFYPIMCIYIYIHIPMLYPQNAMIWTLLSLFLVISHFIPLIPTLVSELNWTMYLTHLVFLPWICRFPRSGKPLYEAQGMVGFPCGSWLDLMERIGETQWLPGLVNIQKLWKITIFNGNTHYRL